VVAVGVEGNETRCGLGAGGGILGLSNEGRLDGNGMFVCNLGSPLGGCEGRSSEGCKPSVSPFVVLMGADGVGDIVEGGGWDVLNANDEGICDGVADAGGVDNEEEDAEGVPAEVEGLEKSTENMDLFAASNVGAGVSVDGTFLPPVKSTLKIDVCPGGEGFSVAGRLEGVDEFGG
jgi:hypothetical protein